MFPSAHLPLSTITNLPASITVAASPLPGGPHGGSIAACHEAKAQQLEKQGNHSAASKETSAAAARKKHYAQGNHKRGEPAICHEAAAVQKQNHGDPKGASAERGKENKELKSEAAAAEKASGKGGSANHGKANHHSKLIDEAEE
jgi:hypothetical protein